MNKIWCLQKVQSTTGMVIAFYLFDSKPTLSCLLPFVFDRECIYDLVCIDGVARDMDGFVWFLSERAINKGGVDE